MRVGLIPLDERPANTRYPRMVGAIAGAEIVLPPPELLSNFREPARIPDLIVWLKDEAPRLNALVISLTTLGHGGLISSRITADPAAEVLNHLQVLRDLRHALPDIQTYGFDIVTRIPDADDATEEPGYWSEHGRKLHRLSALLDRVEAGQDVSEELEGLRADVPEAVVRDFVGRRLRNHAVNLAALELAAAGALDFLVLGSDDTGVWGLGTAERRWLEHWAGLLGLGARTLLYPGADEVGCVLVARLVNDRAGRKPRIATLSTVPGGEEVVAPYEDVPVSRTVERQILAVGGGLAGEDPDLCLALNPPVPDGGDWATSPPSPDDARRPQVRSFVDEVEKMLSRGTPVAVADVAYPNGADPLLIEALRERGVLPHLTAYAGWNTAGNTIGTALAAGCAALSTSGDAGREARECFLLHRLLEDWGYSTLVRPRLRRWLEETSGSPEPDDATLAFAGKEIEDQLAALLDELPDFASRFRVKPGSVRLPWRRTFECDFELETR